MGDSRLIVTVDTNIDEVTNKAEDALIASQRPIYQRSKNLVLPISLKVDASDQRETISPALKVLTATSLRDQLAQAAAWQRWDRRDNAFVPCAPPPEIAELLLSRAGEWRLPRIVGVIMTPTMRPDGSILSAPGYDPITRLFYKVDPELGELPLPEHPTRADAVASLNLLNELLDGFPFVGPVDRSVALSAMLSAVGRASFSVMPLHALSAVASGSGKSYLADVIAAVVTGQCCPVIAWGKGEEADKQLNSILLQALPIVSIDNVETELGGPLLCQAIERPVIVVRRLGTNELPQIESRSIILATGNNLRLVGDMARRSLRCTMDAKMERPETRLFSFKPFEEVVKDRALYVSAALAILQAYQLSGEKIKLQPLQSFGQWSARVREALVWLGCADPAESVEAVRADDPQRNALAAVLASWHNVFGEDAVSIADVTDTVIVREDNDLTAAKRDLREALLAVAGARGAIDNSRLGNYLKRNKDLRLGGYQLNSGERTRTGAQKWKVVRLDGVTGEREADFTNREYSEHKDAMAEQRRSRFRAVD